MFCTTDHGRHRQVRIFITALETTQEVEILDSWRKLAERVRLFPKEPLLTKLAKEIVREYGALGIPVDSVQIEVWRTEYSKHDLYPQSKNLCRFTFSNQEE